MRSTQHATRNTRHGLRFTFYLALAIIAVFFRFYQIGQVPPGLFPDEATHALDALEVLDGQLTIYSPDEGSTGALWRYLLALNFALFGPSILSLRAFASAVGVVSVGMAYLVVRELALAPPAWGRTHRSAPTLENDSVGADPRVRPDTAPPAHPDMAPRVRSEAVWREAIAALAALLLAVSYWHVDLSRTAFSAALMLLIQDATFFCLWRALNSGRRRWFALFGLGLGLLAYNYLPGKLVPAVLLLFFPFQWLVTRRDAMLAEHRRPLLAAGGLALVVALPFALFALFNYQMLMTRAALPMAGAVTPISPLQGMVANLAVFGLWPTPWLSGRWGSFFLGPVLTLCFVVGVGASVPRVRRPTYLFLLVWWLVMLLPGALAPEGAVPHVRRAIGVATPTFALASLGLATLASALVWGMRLLLTGRRSSEGWGLGAVILTLMLGLALVIQTGADTFRRYFVQWGPSEAAKLAFHVYDLELADLMTRRSGGETVYLLLLDSAAGVINPLLDSITFVYQGQASYDFLSDDERTIPLRLAELTANKQIVRLLRWKVTKHTGADPKGVAHYYLEKWGRRVDTESRPYFDIETYELDSVSDAFTPATSTPAEVSFEEQMALAGYAFGDASGGPVDQPSAPAGDLLWAELTWRKTADFSTDYQVALWLEDEAGHEVGRVDKPLLNNLWHRGTSEWAVGAEEGDYYLLSVDPAAPPGTYRLKGVLYRGDNGRRLAPSQPGVGADLAVTLGEVVVRPSPTPPDVTGLPIPQRLDLDVGGGLRLLGLDPGFAGPLRPGDRATLSLWWQAIESPSQNLGVTIGMGRGEQVWALSEPQPLGGMDYPPRDWPARAVVRTFVDLRLPPDVEAGDYDLALRLFDAESGAPLSDWLFPEGDRQVGQVQVTGRARSFEIPPMAYQVGADFGGQVTLLGYDLDLSTVQEGGPARLTLYWQAQREMDTTYKVFVHLLDKSGQIVAQVDREPGAGAAPTTGWLPGEVVADRVEIPSQGLERVQRIALGLYDPASGARLIVRETGADAVTLDAQEMQQ